MLKLKTLTHPATAKWHAGDVFQLVLSNGISEMGVNDKNFQVYPNPMQGQAEISFYAKQAGNARLTINDISGKEILKSENKLLQGIQKYQLNGLNQGVYFINISGDGYFLHYKTNKPKHYAQSSKTKNILETKNRKLLLVHLKSTNATITIPYITGDNLRFTGYAGSLTAIKDDVPSSTKTITYYFTTVPTVFNPTTGKNMDGS